MEVRTYGVVDVDVDGDVDVGDDMGLLFFPKRGWLAIGPCQGKGEKD